MLAKKLLSAAKAVEPVYVEDVFQTWVSTGNGSSRTVTGPDMTKGGLSITKSRSAATGWRFVDTVRGAGLSLESNSTAAQATESTGVTAFTSTGTSIGADADYNTNGATYVDYLLRKQAKFYEQQQISHTNGVADSIDLSSLGTVGYVHAKITNTTGDWIVWHRSLTAGNNLRLNTTAAQTTTDAWLSVSGTTATLSASAPTGTYIIHAFAHDAGGFGLSGTDNVISCGSFTTTGSLLNVTLGYEPQWLMVKRSDNTSNWFMMDAMRGFVTDLATGATYLMANSANAEASGIAFAPTATGFSTNLGAGSTYIYIAIRRGPMKVPTDGTKVLNTITRSGNSTATTVTGVGFAPDLVFEAARTNSGGNNWVWFDRLRGGAQGLSSDNTGAEFTNSVVIQADSLSTTMDGFRIQTANPINASGNTYVYYPLKRAPGFFDEVCYTGTGVARTVSHNLGVVPELMIVKGRSVAEAWVVYSATLGSTKYLRLNAVSASASDGGVLWNNTSPTSSVFSLGDGSGVNTSAGTFTTYLFATCPGVSKVGSYTGTGTTLQIDCGFAGGARFVLIKRTDSTGDWYVWDSARGIVAGNDPYLLLNSTAAEVTTTDYIDTYSAGFEISSTAPAAINANGGSFIFLAIS